MIYLSSFKLCDEILTNPNIYPHNVFRNKDMPTLLQFYMVIMVRESLLF